MCWPAVRVYEEGRWRTEEKLFSPRKRWGDERRGGAHAHGIMNNEPTKCPHGRQSVPAARESDRGHRRHRQTSQRRREASASQAHGRRPASQKGDTRSQRLAQGVAHRSRASTIERRARPRPEVGSSRRRRAAESRAVHGSLSSEIPIPVVHAWWFAVGCPIPDDIFAVLPPAGGVARPSSRPSSTACPRLGRPTPDDVQAPGAPASSTSRELSANSLRRAQEESLDGGA